MNLVIPNLIHQHISASNCANVYNFGKADGHRKGEYITLWRRGNGKIATKGDIFIPSYAPSDEQQG